LSPKIDTKPPPVDGWFPLEKDEISGPSYVTNEFKLPTADATVIDKATDLPVPAYPMQADEVVDIQDAETQGRPLTAMVVVAEYVPKLLPRIVNGRDPSVGTFTEPTKVGLGAS